MKYFTLLTLLVSISFTTKSQETFYEVGSSFSSYYDGWGSDRLTYFTVLNDIDSLGYTLSKVQITSHHRTWLQSGPNDPGYYSQPDTSISYFYTLYRNDSLFELKSGSLKFVCSFGDSVGTKWELNQYKEHCPDGYVEAEITAKENIVLGDTSFYALTITTTDTTNDGGQNYEEVHTFYKGIGQIRTPLLGLRLACDDVIVDYAFGGLKCYTSPSGKLTFLNGTSKCPSYVGIEDKVSSNIIKAYPNPASDYINIHAEKAGELKVYSCTGKEVLQTTLHGGEQTVNVSVLETGVYFLQQENGARYKLLIK